MDPEIYAPRVGYAIAAERLGRRLNRASDLLTEATSSATRSARSAKLSELENQLRAALVHLDLAKRA